MLKINSSKTMKLNCSTGIGADEDQAILPKGMEPVDSDKRFHPTDRTDREMAIRDIIAKWTNCDSLLVSKNRVNLVKKDFLYRCRH